MTKWTEIQGRTVLLKKEQDTDTGFPLEEPRRKKEGVPFQ